MSRNLQVLIGAQFLSAFADNAILFAVIAMVLQAEAISDWYVPALQSVFLLAFVLLAPWAGPFADQRTKPRVLVLGNIIKALGVVLILFDLEPLFAYAAVGIGAALYSPAKYGILPDLVDSAQLVKANSWVEGSTILAIISGMVIGSRVADHSIPLALKLIVGLYCASAVLSTFLPKTPTKGALSGSAISVFSNEMKHFFATSRARFAVLGASLFWAAAATLRVIIVAWAPLVLSLSQASDIAELTLYLAIGIIIGSAVVPSLISIDQLRRARLPGYLMAIFIILLGLVDTILAARSVMLVIGIAGGMFVVPVNAALQDIGHRTIGSGGAVAIQNFFANISMLLAVGAYTLAAVYGYSPVTALMVLGSVVLVATFVISLHLPRATPE